MKLQINQHTFGLLKVLALVLCAMFCNNGNAQHGASPAFTETVLEDTGGSGAATIGGNKKLDVSGFSVHGHISCRAQEFNTLLEIQLADTGGAGTTVMTSGAGNKKLDTSPQNQVHHSADKGYMLHTSPQVSIVDTGGNTAVGTSSSTAGNKKLDCQIPV